MLKNLRDELYPAISEGKRLVDCLPVVDRWGKGVWEGIPDNGVEVSPHITLSVVLMGFRRSWLCPSLRVSQR